MGILQKWFNLPYSKSMPFITSNSGQKYWLEIDQKDLFQISLFTYGRLVGYVRWVWKNHPQIELGDIFLVEEYRNQGVGSRFMQFLLALARQNGVKTIWAAIQPEKPELIGKLVKWYQAQGFYVQEHNGHYCGEIQLSNDQAHLN